MKSPRRVLPLLIVLLILGVAGSVWLGTRSPPDPGPETASEPETAPAGREEVRSPRVRRAVQGDAAPTSPETADETPAPSGEEGAPGDPGRATAGTEPAAVKPSPEPPPKPPTPSAAGSETGDLRVSVTDGAGGGRGGARVDVYAKVDGSFERTHRVTTDPGGRADAPGLSPGSASIVVEIGSLRRRLRASVVAGTMTEVTVEIPPGATVQGEVRHVDKGLLPGIWVRIGELVRMRGDGGHHDQLYATTDAKGRYRLEEVPAGTHLVALRGEAIGYHPRARAELVVSGPGSFTHDFVLGEVSLAGIVRDAATGAPISAASVNIQSPFYYAATTDAAGAYRFLDLPPGSYRMAVTHDGHELLFLESGPVEEGRRRALDIDLRPAAALLLTVTDDGGRPVGGSLTLSVIPLQGDDAEAGRSSASGVQTDASGHARYARIVPGKYDLELRGDGYEPHRVRKTVRDGENGVSFRLTRKDVAPSKDEVVIRGTVRDARTGAPISGVRVTVGGSSPPMWLTDAEGRYELRTRWHGKRRLSLSRDGYGFRFLDPMKIPAGTERVVDAELEPAATLRLRIRGPDGRPVVGRLTLAMSPVKEGVGTSLGTGIEADANGLAVYSQILPARYRLLVIADGVGRSKVETEVFPGENRVDIDLE